MVGADRNACAQCVLIDTVAVVLLLTVTVKPLNN